MESGAITDEQITSSSEHNSKVNAVHSAKHGRLHFQEITNQEAGAWVANASDDNPWLQIDLIGQYIVTRVATQGRNSSNYQQWVTNYKLQYGDDEDQLQNYIQHVQGQATDKVKSVNVFYRSVLVDIVCQISVSLSIPHGLIMKLNEIIG